MHNNVRLGKWEVIIAGNYTVNSNQNKWDHKMIPQIYFVFYYFSKHFRLFVHFKFVHTYMFALNLEKGQCLVSVRMNYCVNYWLTIYHTDIQLNNVVICALKPRSKSPTGIWKCSFIFDTQIQVSGCSSTSFKVRLLSNQQAMLCLNQSSLNLHIAVKGHWRDRWPNPSTERKTWTTSPYFWKC